MDNYPVPIDVNEHAAEIRSSADSTVITFSHANFTMRETILAPKNVADGSGALVFFQIEAIRPTTFTFSFTPNMQAMWPAHLGRHAVAGMDWIHFVQRILYAAS